MFMVRVGGLERRSGGRMKSDGKWGLGGESGTGRGWTRVRVGRVGAGGVAECDCSECGSDWGYRVEVLGLRRVVSSSDFS